MAKNERTSKEIGTIAAQKLADPKTPKDVKRLAGSLLTQLPDKKAPAPKKGRR